MRLNRYRSCGNFVSLFIVLGFSFSSDSYTITETEDNLSLKVTSLGAQTVDIVFKYSTKVMLYTENGKYTYKYRK